VTLHTGTDYEVAGVRIGAPDPEAICAAPKGRDVAASVDRWLSDARGRDDVHYFAVYERERLVGQIVLHDINPQTGEALVGYHLFEPRSRGRGVGTTMLGLLQRHVREATALRRLVVITSDDNVASQRVALKCGFVPIGAPREDPLHGVCLEWRVARDVSPEPLSP
jgi:RimJ/RimL family protein N-acetyltransferase